MNMIKSRKILLYKSTFQISKQDVQIMVLIIHYGLQLFNFVILDMLYYGYKYKLFRYNTINFFTD